jgi:hypothetical protein
MVHADRVLLSALAVELADVRAGVDGLSDLISGMIRNLPAETRVSALSDAQALDVLTQRIDVVSDLLQALAAGRPASEAIRAVPLADMARRLAGAPAPAASADASGDLMLFD